MQWNIRSPLSGERSLPQLVQNTVFGKLISSLVLFTPITIFKLATHLVHTSFNIFDINDQFLLKVLLHIKLSINRYKDFKNIFITPKLYHTQVTLFETEAQLAGTQETALAQTDIS